MCQLKSMITVITQDFNCMGVVSPKHRTSGVKGHMFTRMTGNAALMVFQSKLDQVRSAILYHSQNR